jgi:hypothetical protein
MAKHPPTTRGSSNPLSNQPWWVQAIALVGAPVAGLAWIIWMFFGNFNVKLDSIDHRLSSHEMAATATSSAFTKHLDDDVTQRWLLISTLQRICLNTSKTDNDRLACALSNPSR